MRSGCCALPPSWVFPCATHHMLAALPTSPLQVEGGVLGEAERRHDPAVPALPRPMIPFSPDALPGLCAMQASGPGRGCAGDREVARTCGRGLQAGAPPGSGFRALCRLRMPLPLLAAAS